MFDELIGERIFLVKKSGHEKTGTLEEIAERFLKIKFYDGRGDNRHHRDRDLQEK